MLHSTTAIEFAECLGIHLSRYHRMVTIITAVTVFIKHCQLAMLNWHSPLVLRFHPALSAVAAFGC